MHTNTATLKEVIGDGEGSEYFYAENPYAKPSDSIKNEIKEIVNKEIVKLCLPEIKERMSPYEDNLVSNIIREIYLRSKQNKTIIQDKANRIGDYLTYLKRGNLSTQHINFLKEKEFGVGETGEMILTENVAALLWCLYPDSNSSLGALYESNALKMIEGEVNNVKASVDS